VIKLSDGYFYHERNLDGKIDNNYKGKGDEFKKLKTKYYDKYKKRQLSVTGIDESSIIKKWITTQSKLRSTILEEFCGYLFKDVATIKKLSLDFFNKKIYAGMAIDSSGKIYPKTKDVDFCIGKEIIANFENRKYKIIIPLIAIECKTWLDKTMFSEAQFTAQKLKQGTPDVRVYILSGYSIISKNEIPNKGQTSIDQIFLIGNTRTSIDENAVFEFFQEVKNALSRVTADITIKDIGKLLPE
jgi:hypothetical protein